MQRIATILSILLGLAVPATAQLTVGSLAASRIGDWTLDGIRMNDTRAKLENPANFGPGGTVETALAITDVAGPLTPATLAAFDVFFVGYAADGTLGAAELTALDAWVRAGGWLIVTCDETSYDDVCAHFERAAQGIATPPTAPALLQDAHPLFTGPFGVAREIANDGEYSFFAPGLDGLVLAEDSLGRTMILLRGVGSGRVLYLSDVDMISDDTVTAGGDIHWNDDNDVLLGNLFAALTGDGCRLDALCLGDGRFELRVTWRTPAGLSGLGKPVPLARDSGTFWFFAAANSEMLIKVLEGCAINDRYWIFAGGLTNVRVRMRVRDTLHDTTEVYVNPLDTPFVAIQDTDAFATCP